MIHERDDILGLDAIHSLTGRGVVERRSHAMRVSAKVATMIGIGSKHIVTAKGVIVLISKLIIKDL